MEEIDVEIIAKNKEKVDVVVKEDRKNQQQIVGAIILAGFLIAGAILLKGSSVSKTDNTKGENEALVTTLAPVNKEDNILGNPNAKITVVMYEDFQCPFCGVISGFLPADAPILKSLQQRDPTWMPSLPEIMNYVKAGSVQFVYRDFPFLGPESFKASEAARCAKDQGKFWEYHDYLYSHQNGENEGGFADLKLKSFAKILGLNTADFDKCLDTGKYTQAVLDSKNEGANAGVSGTPKGFILKNGKTFSTIDGAEPAKTVKQKIEAALK